MSYCYLVRFKNSEGRIEEYALLASCINECKAWVAKLNRCLFLSATLIV